MIWNVLLVVMVALTVWRYWAIRDYKKPTYDIAGGPQIVAGLLAGTAVAMLLATLICVGSNSSDISVYRRSGELVELKVSQRDALAALVQDELSIEQYEAVMAATPDADILVILGNNASTFLVEKTRLLVAINTELNSLVNGLARDRIELCAWADNPLSPRLFVSPSCPAPIQLP